MQTMHGNVLTSMQTHALWLGSCFSMDHAKQQKDSDGWMEGTARAGFAFRIWRGVWLEEGWMTQQINGSCGETAPGVEEGSPGCKGFGSQGFWCLKAHPLGLLGSWSLVQLSWLDLRCFTQHQHFLILGLLSYLKSRQQKSLQQQKAENWESIAGG